MIELPKQSNLADGLAVISGQVHLFTTPSARAWANAQLPWPPASQMKADGDWLVVVGGGNVIDEAKALKLNSPRLHLAVIPSIWGSGAEASPVIVLNRDGRKHIQVARQALPDLIIWAPELANTVASSRAVLACGDVWSHALEGFLSPLATDELRIELASLINELCRLPLASDSRWFHASALASAGQAMASVGLVHGIAHELEGHLPEPGHWHHASLCAAFLLPVMRFNAQRSEKMRSLAKQYGLNLASIWQQLSTLYEAGDYAQTLAALKARWRQVLLNPCTRTNSTLVNASTLDFLLNFDHSRI